MSSHEHRKRSRSPDDRSRRDRGRDGGREKDASSSRHSSSRHSSSRGDHTHHTTSREDPRPQDRSRSDRDDRDTRSSRSSGHRDDRDREKERKQGDDRDRSSRHARDRERDRERDRDHRSKRSRRDKESESDRDSQSDSQEDDEEDTGSSSSDDDAEEEDKKKSDRKEKDQQPPQLSRKAISKGATAPISTDDYFLKSTEFRLWLRKSKKKYFDRLSSSKSHGYFRKFVKAWNNGDLDDTYYKGVRSSELASQGTKYKWGFVKKMGEKDQDELERTKDSIDSLTNSAKRFAEEMNTSSSSASAASKRFHDPTTAPSGASSMYSRRPNNADDVYEREELDRQRRQTQRAQDRAYRKSREADLEELVPKATGREAMLEKRKAQTEYHRRERSPGVELSEQDMMGGGDDFRSALAAERRARQQREERQQMRRDGGSGGGVLDVRKQAYQEKEQGKIEALRQLWMQSQGAKRD
ncbi:hypothetical protein BGZ73_007367 [Actinomortierella ambigua]|nr:hypothetical protein BGZ73_007367 [Actinomortierella ambigua]